MKKILTILIMLAALLASCDGKPAEKSNNAGLYCIYVDTIRGHEYLIYDGDHSGNIIHSASCPCKKGGNDETE